MWPIAVAVVVGSTQVALPPLVKAGQFEAVGQWRLALSLYSSELSRSGSNPIASNGLRRCLRRSLQADRIRDDRYSDWMAKLTLADVLQLYSDVLSQLAAKSPEAIAAVKMFAEGAIEFERATFDEHFRTTRLTGLSPEFARREARRMAAGGRIRNVADARAELRELVVRFVTMAPKSDGVAIAMQFVAGACAAIDEWTTLRPPEMTPTITETITGIMLAEPDVGYLRVVSFGETTVSEFNSAVGLLVNQGAKSLVVDLRGNPGGLLAAGIELSKRLLPTGEILRTAGRNPAFSGRIVSSDSGFNALPIPLVVLVDAETMSTAEIVATAIQSNGRGRLVGMPTFGKGTVQTSVELKAGGKSVLIVTVATVADRQGRSMAGRPISPDLREPDPDLQLKMAVAEAKSVASIRMP